MTVRTSPRNWLSALARGSLPARRGNARRAAGPCLAALAFCTILAACSEGQSVSEESQAASLEEFLEKNMVRTADCNGTGTVANLDSKDDFITVFSGPSISSPPQIRLKAGVLMHLCTRAENRRYVGIIYQSDGELAELSQCQIATGTVPHYKRPCISGWVYTRDIEDGRIAARYSERKETKAADEEPAIAPGDDMAAIDRLNDELNGKFPTKVEYNDGRWFYVYRSLGFGCKSRLKRESYGSGYEEYIADFDYSEIIKVSDAEKTTVAQSNMFFIVVHLPPDEAGLARVKRSTASEGVNLAPVDSINLVLPSQEAAEEVRETLLQLRSLCRARKRREQANAGDARYRASRDPDLHVAADRHHLAQGGAHARDLG